MISLHFILRLPSRTLTSGNGLPSTPPAKTKTARSTTLRFPRNLKPWSLKFLNLLITTWTKIKRIRYPPSILLTIKAKKNLAIEGRSLLTSRATGSKDPQIKVTPPHQKKKTSRTSLLALNQKILPTQSQREKLRKRTPKIAQRRRITLAAQKILKMMEFKGEIPIFREPTINRLPSSWTQYLTRKTIEMLLIAHNKYIETRNKTIPKKSATYPSTPRMSRVLIKLASEVLSPRPA